MCKQFKLSIADYTAIENGQSNHTACYRIKYKYEKITDIDRNSIKALILLKIGFNIFHTMYYINVFIQKLDEFDRNLHRKCDIT